MKIPLLILCLLMVYGLCRAYGEVDDVARKIQNNEDYKNYANVSYTFLARHKRAGLLSPVSDLINVVFGLFKNFIPDCTNVEDFSLEFINLLEEGDLIGLFKNILCHIINGITEGGETFIAFLEKYGEEFLFNIVLPTLYKMLKWLMGFSFIEEMLPEKIRTLIETFITFYPMLSMFGFGSTKVQPSIY